jgi:DNA-binding response OmpR family regulator
MQLAPTTLRSLEQPGWKLSSSSKGAHNTMLSTTQIIHTPVPATEKISILLVSPHRDDYSCIRNILHHDGWDISCRTNAKEAIAYLEANAPSTVICERDLPDGSWRDILSRSVTLTHPPLVVVASRHADENLWGEVLNLGGYDVLIKPFDRSELTRVVGMAWRHWLHPARFKEAPQFV